MNGIKLPTPVYKRHAQTMHNTMERDISCILLWNDMEYNEDLNIQI